MATEITHHETGERIRFLASDPLLMEDDVPAGSSRGPVHAHPSQVEEFYVVRGSYELLIEGEARTLRTGDSATVPAGVAHTGRSLDGALLRITFTPALRWEQFVRRLFAGEPADSLLAAFPDEIRVAH